MRGKRGDRCEVRQFRDLGGSKPWAGRPDGEQHHQRPTDRRGGELRMIAPIVRNPCRIGIDSACAR